jgi:RNA polymerase sigma-70 factor (ECF subfamily)
VPARVTTSPLRTKREKVLFREDGVAESPSFENVEAPPGAAVPRRIESRHRGVSPEDPGTERVSKSSKTVGEASREAGPLPDDEVVGRCLAGDTEAFGRLVTRYQDRIHHACLRIVGDRETALEMAQETFLRAYRRLATFRRGARFSTWLFAIAINQCRSELRRRKTVKHRPPLSLDASRVDEEGGRWEPPSSEPDPSDRAARHELAVRLQRELAELPETFRIPIVLRDVDGLSYEEIAEAIGAPVGTVRSRIHRGRIALRDRLGDVMS